MVFKYEAKAWQRALLQKLPIERLVPNLIISSPGDEVDKSGRHPAVLLTHGPADWFLSSFDLHSQALLTTFLQSNQSAPTSASGQVQSLSEVTFKRGSATDLLVSQGANDEVSHAWRAAA